LCGMELEGVSMTTTQFSNSTELNVGFKSHINGYHKIHCIYYIFKLETPNTN